jgi:hypothetical protein
MCDCPHGGLLSVGRITYPRARIRYPWHYNWREFPILNRWARHERLRHAHVLLAYHFFARLLQLCVGPRLVRA